MHIYLNTDSAIPISGVVGIAGTNIVVTGDTEGNLWRWEDAIRVSKITATNVDYGDLTIDSADIRAHTGSITAMTALVYPGGAIGFASASRDAVKLWILTESSFELNREFSIAEVLSRLNQDQFLSADSLQGGSFVTCISADAKGSRLLLSVSCGRLIEVTIDSRALSLISQGENRKVDFLVSEPSPSSPSSATVLTVTEERTINLWDYGAGPQTSIVSSLNCGHTVSSLGFLGSGLTSKVAVGLSNCDDNGGAGSVLILDLVSKKELVVVHRIHSIGAGSVNDVKLSPDGKILAVGSQDGNIYLYSYESASGTASLLGRYSLPSPSSESVPVNAIDFSVCSRYLRVFGPTVSGNKRVISAFFDLSAVAVGSTVEASTDDAVLGSEVVTPDEIVLIRDSIKFFPGSSPAATECRSAYIPSMKKVGAGVTLRDMSSTDNLVAASYSDGIVRIFRKNSIYGEPLISFYAASPSSDTNTKVRSHRSMLRLFWHHLHFSKLKRVRPCR
jgi:WD40 repeat protein